MKLIDHPEKYTMDPVADPLPPSATSKHLPTLEALAMGTRITTTAEMISWINAKARTSETITTTSKNLKPIYIRQNATELARSIPTVSPNMANLVKENLLLRFRLIQMERRLMLLESSPKE